MSLFCCVYAYAYFTCVMLIPQVWTRLTWPLNQAFSQTFMSNLAKNLKDCFRHLNCLNVAITHAVIKWLGLVIHIAAVSFSSLVFYYVLHYTTQRTFRLLHANWVHSMVNESICIRNSNYNQICFLYSMWTQSLLVCNKFTFYNVQVLYKQTTSGPRV